MADVLGPIDDTFLPDETWTAIFKNLNSKDLATVSLVSRRFYDIVRPILWYAPEFGDEFFGGEDEHEDDDNEDNDTFQLRGVLPALFEGHVPYDELICLSDFPIKCLKLSQFQFELFSLEETVAAIIQNFDITSFQIDSIDSWRLSMEDLCILFKLPVTFVDTSCIHFRGRYSRDASSENESKIEEFVKYIRQYPTMVSIDESLHSTLTLEGWKMLTTLPLSEVNVCFDKNQKLKINIEEYLEVAEKIQLQPLSPRSSVASSSMIARRKPSFKLRSNFSLSELQKFLRCDSIRIDEINISYMDHDVRSSIVAGFHNLQRCCFNTELSQH